MRLDARDKDYKIIPNLGIYLNGEKIDIKQVFCVDEEAGEIHRYLTDINGKIYPDETGKAAKEVLKGNVKIVIPEAVG